MGDKVNNWKAAEELQRFKVRTLDPQKKRVEEARKILEDPNYKWRKGEKDASKNKFLLLETKNIDNHRIYSACMELITQHEDLTDMLTEIYQTWFMKVSSDGEQPAEMMGSQAEILQELFSRLHEALLPLNIDLDKPKSQSDEK